MNLDRAQQLLSKLPVKDRDSGLIVKFVFNANQQTFMTALKEQWFEIGMVRAIVLKARRVGISSASDGLLVPHCLSRPQAHAKIVAHRADTAEGLFRVPRDLARALPFPVGEIMTRKIIFHHPRGNSVMDIATAGAVSGGRGLTLSALHLSEAAQFTGEDSFLSLLPAVQNGPGSMVFIESTAFGRVGVGKAFYEFWTNSVKGKTGYIPIFLPWLDDPACVRDPSEATDAPANDIEKSLMARPFQANRAQIAWFRHTLESQCQGLLPKMMQEFPHCITAETRVSTDQGIIPLRDAAHAKYSESGRVLAWGPQKPSPIFRLTTRDGRTLRGTANHPVAVPDGFISLSDLKPGQQIELRPPIFAAEPYAEIWYDFPCVESRIDIDTNWGRFLGYFMGAGCWYHGALSIACDAKDDDVIADVICLTKLVTGRTPQTRSIARVQGRKGCVEVRLSVAEFQRVLEHLNLLKVNSSSARSRRVHVPNCIMRSPQPVVRAFLQSLFECDGSNTQNQVRFASSHREFIQDIQLLLLGFGINARIYENVKKSGSGGTYTCYELSMGMAASVRFHEVIGFVGNRKNTWRPPAKIVHERGMRDEVLSVIEESSSEVTFDFTIEGAHVFSANGILTHNTPEVAFVASGDPAFTEEEIAYVRSTIAPPAFTGHLDLVDGKPTIAKVKRGRGSLIVWEPPEPGHRYYIGADAATGIEDGDFASYVILNGTTGKMAARYAERVHPENLARQLWMAGLLYNTAKINVELTGHLGRVIQRILRDDYRYWNLYGWKGRDDRLPSPQGSSGPRAGGWETTPTSRRLLIDTFRTALRSGMRDEIGGIEIPDEAVIDQMDLATLTEGMNWEVEREHDDILFATMLAVITFVQYPPPRMAGRSRRPDPEATDTATRMPITVKNELPISLGDHLRQLERSMKRAGKPEPLSGI